LLAGKGKRILFVYGKSGIGKTTVVKHVTSKLEEELLM
jgi:Cdc6-like AAA superfamily ATPase